jgi:hypothetical protein
VWTLVRESSKPSLDCIPNLKTNVYDKNPLIKQVCYSGLFFFVLCWHCRLWTVWRLVMNVQPTDDVRQSQEMISKGFIDLTILWFVPHLFFFLVAAFQSITDMRMLRPEWTNSKQYIIHWKPLMSRLFLSHGWTPTKLTWSGFTMVTCSIIPTPPPKGGSN